MEQTLNFTRHARQDPTRWLFAATGVMLLAGVAWDVTVGLAPWGATASPLMAGGLALGGALLAGIGGTALARNTSRGCRVDPQTHVLRWWHMAGADALNHTQQVDLQDVTEMAVASDGDATQVHIHTRTTVNPLRINADALPPDLDRWVATLRARYPHITAPPQP